MNTPLLKDLQELVNARIITAETAQQITAYYQSKKNTPSNRFGLVLGILGALLVGSGIILLVAHNWDFFNRLTKTIIAFVPLVIAQAICLYALLRKKDNRVWQECSAVLLFCAVPSTISMISQLYHIDGSLSDFLFTWLMLTIPLVYIAGSHIVSLLVIAIATWYGCEIGYHALFSSAVTHQPYVYLLIVAALMPWYYRMAVKNSNSNFFHAHNWFLPVSFAILLGTFSGNHDDTDWMFAGYISLFGFYYVLGNTPYFQRYRFWGNPFYILGIAGMLSILIGWSFRGPWQHLMHSNIDKSSLRLFIITGLLLIASLLLIIRNAKVSDNRFDLAAYSPFLFCLLLFLAGTNIRTGSFLINCWVIAIAVFYIRKGSMQNHFGILNFGLIIIALLAIFRFFDNEIPFIWRGTFFLAAGAGFFAANYLLLKRRKTLTPNTDL